MVGLQNRMTLSMPWLSLPHFSQICRSSYLAISVVVESNEFESKSKSESSESKSESSWLISDLGIYVAREPKNANFEKCNHKNLSTLKTVVTKLGLSHMQ